MLSISVIIPCYNAERFLAEALASVLAQTRQPHEIIVVDDCSTDGSLAVAEQWAAAHPGIRVLRMPQNGGDAPARNAAVREATGELVAMLDADDAWEPFHLEEVAGLLDAHPEAVVAGSAVRRTGSRDGLWTPRFAPGVPTRVFELALWQAPQSHSTVVIRRAALLELGGYDETSRCTTDVDMWIRLSYRHPFVCTHRVTGTYHWHEQQTSRAPTRQIAARHRFRYKQLQQMRAEGSPEVAMAERVLCRTWQRDLRYGLAALSSEEVRVLFAQWRISCVPRAVAAAWWLRTTAELARRGLRARVRDALPPALLARIKAWRRRLASQPWVEGHTQQH